jgi:hypothetical protein
MNEPINWQGVAAEYRRRLHSVCSFAALTLYVATCFGLAQLAEGLSLDPIWVENIALFIWLPMGALAFYFKNRLEDWADRRLPRP